MTYCEKCKSTNVIESENGNHCCNCGWDSTKKEYVKKQTNADKIRAMNDEELAEFLLNVNTSYEDSCVTNCKWEDYPTRDKGCKDCFLEYLRKEAE